MRKPEVLAPAGDLDALKAAVAAGADAVYFGLSAWSARARATNFGEDALGEAMRVLHRHGRKGYVAINTLVFDAELDAVEQSIRQCAAAGVDAIIVQDLGVARLIRAIAPDMPIHASTQMTCTDAGAVNFAGELGASRVILARELSLDDIAEIRRGTDVEIEVFVHGALCVAYSGQCLTSEAIGGRSANRGACAQACRLPYDLIVDGVRRDTGDRAFLLSPQDLEASELIPRLAAEGVASVKIEGRLKGPAYVASTTALYRKAVDALESGSAPSAADREVALATFTRGSGPGFLGGVDHQQLVDGSSCDHRGALVGTVLSVTREGPKTWIEIEGARPIEAGQGILVQGKRGGAGETGGRVWLTRSGSRSTGSGVRTAVWLGPERSITTALDLRGRSVFLSDDPAAEKAALAIASGSPTGVPVAMTLHARVGEVVKLSASLPSGATCTVVSEDLALVGRSGATSEDVIRDKLGRLGDSPFTLGALSVDIEGDVMIAPSLLNRLRRAVVTELLTKQGQAWSTTDVTWRSLDAPMPALREPAPAGLFVLCRSLEQAVAARDAGADGVWLDILELAGTGAALRALRSSGSGFIGVAPPRIRKPGEEKIDKFLASLEPDGVLVRGLGALHDVANDTRDIVRIGDYSLNATNQLTVHELLRRGLSGFTPAFDLDAAQLLALVRSPMGRYAEVVVHHPMPLFHMEHCVFARELSTGKDHRDCGRPCEKHSLSLRDRAGIEHPVLADVGCRNTVFHASSQSAASLWQPLVAANVGRFRVELVRESAAEVTTIVTAYRELMDKRTVGSDIFGRLRAESTYGVVRGSLRVLA